MSIKRTSPKKRVRPTNDFFGPSYRIKFYAPNQAEKIPEDADAAVERPQLTEDQQVLDGLAIQNYVTSLTIESFTGMMKCEVVIAPPFEDAINILEKRAIQFNGTMGIKWGYADQDLISGEHLFTIIHPRVSFSKDVTITITGIDTVSNGTKRETTKKVYTREKYKKDIFILNEIATRYDFTIDRTYAPKSSSLTKPEKIDAIKTTAVPQAGNDWQLFKAICQENELHFNIGSGNTIFLARQTSITSLPTDYRFLWYGAPQDNYDIPMMSFTTNVIPSIFTPDSAIAQGLLTTKVDTDSNTVKARNLDGSRSPEFTAEGDKKVDNTAAGTTQQQGQPSKTEDAIIKSIPSFDVNIYGMHISIPNLAADKSIMLARESHNTVNTTATIIAPGHPDVVPPLNIEVANVGPFSGKYMLIKSKHVLNQSGYEMTLEAVRTTSPSKVVFGNPANVGPSSTSDGKAPSGGKDPNITGGRQ